MLHGTKDPYRVGQDTHADAVGVSDFVALV